MEIGQILSSAIASAPSAQIVGEPTFGGERISLYLYPFWIVKEKSGDAFTTYVIDGVKKNKVNKVFTHSPPGVADKIGYLLFLLILVGVPLILLVLLISN